MLRLVPCCYRSTSKLLCQSPRIVLLLASLVGLIGCGGELAESDSTSSGDSESMAPMPESQASLFPQTTQPTPRQPVRSVDPLEALFKDQTEPPIELISAPTRSSQGVTQSLSGPGRKYASAMEFAEARVAFRSALCDWAVGSQGKSARSNDEDAWTREVIAKELIESTGRSWEALEVASQAFSKKADSAGDPLLNYALGVCARKNHRYLDSFESFKASAIGFSNSDYPGLGPVLTHRAIFELLIHAYSDMSVIYRALQNYDNAIQHWVFNDFQVADSDMRLAFAEVGIYPKLAEDALIRWSSEPMFVISHMANVSPSKLPTQLRIKLANSTVHHPWFANAVCGAVHYHLAWATRGHGAASEVNPQLMAQAETEARTAYDFYLKAHNSDPNNPESAEGLLGTCGFLAATFEIPKWFDEAYKAQPDYYPAYSAYCNYYGPSWYDEPQAIVSLAPRIAAIQDHSSGLQLYFAAQIAEMQARTGSRLFNDATISDIANKALADAAERTEAGGCLLECDIDDLRTYVQFLSSTLGTPEALAQALRVANASGTPGADNWIARDSSGWNQSLLVTAAKEAKNLAATRLLESISSGRDSREADWSSVKELAQSFSAEERAVIESLATSAEQLSAVISTGELQEISPAEIRWLFSSVYESQMRWNSDGTLTLFSSPSRDGIVHLQLPTENQFEFTVKIRLDQMLGECFCGGVTFDHPMVAPYASFAGFASSNSTVFGDGKHRVWQRPGLSISPGKTVELRVLRTGDHFWLWVDGVFGGEWTKSSTETSTNLVFVSGLKHPGLGQVTIESIGMKSWEGPAIPFLATAKEALPFFEAYLEAHPDDAFVSAYYAMHLAQDSQVARAEELLSGITSANDSFSAAWVKLAEGYCLEWKGDWQGALKVYGELIAPHASDIASSKIESRYRSVANYGTWEHALLRYQWIRAVNAPQATGTDYKTMEPLVSQFVRNEFVSARHRMAQAASAGDWQLHEIVVNYAAIGWGESADDSRAQTAAYRARTVYTSDKPLFYEWLCLGNGTLKPFEDAVEQIAR